MLLWSFCLLLLPTRVFSTCYNPDGSPEDDSAYQPCIAIGGAKTMCCATNRTNPSEGHLSNGWVADLCLENGLCQNVVNVTEDAGQSWTLSSTFWRDQCWSPHWNISGNCLNYCMGSTTSEMTPCDGTKNSSTWCCGSNNKTCCGTSSAINLAQTFGDYSSSNTSTSTSQSTDTFSSSSKMPINTQIAIGMGVALGVMILISGLAFFFLWRQRNQKNEQEILPMGFHRQVERIQELNSGTTRSIPGTPAEPAALELPGSNFK